MTVKCPSCNHRIDELSTAVGKVEYAGFERGLVVAVGCPKCENVLGTEAFPNE